MFYPIRNSRRNTIDYMRVPPFSVYPTSPVDQIGSFSRLLYRTYSNYCKGNTLYAYCSRIQPRIITSFPTTPYESQQQLFPPYICYPFGESFGKRVSASKEVTCLFFIPFVSFRIEPNLSSLSNDSFCNILYIYILQFGNSTFGFISYKKIYRGQQ